MFEQVVITLFKQNMVIWFNK